MDEQISIIVPVYQAQAFLEECIESVLSQSYPHFELLLIDDGSTDRSPALCDAYEKKDRRIRVFHKKNGGVSSARNLGLDRAQGQYLMFLDADDALTPDCLETLLQALLRHDADIASGLASNAPAWGSGREECAVWRGTKGLEEMLGDNQALDACWARLYKAALIGDTRFSEQYRVSEDSLFMLQLLCKRPTMVQLRKEVYLYRVHPDSCIHSAFGDRFFDSMKALEDKAALIESLYPDLHPLVEDYKLKSKLLFLWELAGRTRGEHADFEKALKRDILENRHYFRPGYPAYNKLMFIVRHRLFGAYAFLKRTLRR